MLTLETLEGLQSPSGQAALAALANEDLSDAQTLRLLTRLRRDFVPELAGAVLEQARLRQRGQAKFGADAAALFYTTDALEQASDPLVRRYRALKLAGAQVIDAGCGMGADSLAFAAAGCRVLGLDLDPVRVAIAQHNAAQLGLSDRVRFQVYDLRTGLPELAEAIFFDPARRDTAGRRIHDVEAYEPPLSLMRQWQADRILAKLSPGVDLAQLQTYPGLLEFISVAGDMKEALLWLNEPVGRRATLLSDTGTLNWQAEEIPPRPLSVPLRWLVEPDPALLRAGLVQQVAAAFDGYLLDETIAYFTCAEKPRSAWLRAWRILDWMPFHMKRLRSALREQNVGQVTVKKRGSPLTPEELMRQLRLKGGTQSRTLVLTRHAGNPIVLICADFVPGQPDCL